MNIPRNATATAETTRLGTSQKMSSSPIVRPRYSRTERNSPSLAVRNESPIRPTVIPPQKPVDVAPEAKGEAWRMEVMKVTIQPPRETATS
jgi:hypothetical protein